MPLTIYCQSNIDPGKKEFLLHEGANLVLHGNDCVEAELKARSDAQVSNQINITYHLKAILAS